METTYRYLERETVQIDDGQDYTRAVFRECNLIYSGGEAQVGGATFYSCSIRFDGYGTRARDLQRAIFRSLYAQGVRSLWIDENGDYSTSP